MFQTAWLHGSSGFVPSSTVGTVICEHVLFIFSISQCWGEPCRGQTVIHNGWMALNHHIYNNWRQIWGNTLKCSTKTWNLKWPCLNYSSCLLPWIPVAALPLESHSPPSLFLKFDSSPSGTWRSEVVGLASSLLFLLVCHLHLILSHPPPVFSPHPWDTQKVIQGHITQTHGQLSLHWQKLFLSKSLLRLHSDFSWQVLQARWWTKVKPLLRLVGMKPSLEATFCLMFYLVHRVNHAVPSPQISTHISQNAILCKIMVPPFLCDVHWLYLFSSHLPVTLKFIILFGKKLSLMLIVWWLCL